MNIPVNTQLPFLISCYGCTPQVGPDKILNISAGRIRDKTNQYDIVIPSILTIDPETVGANGIDTGVFQGSKLYAVYAIGDNTKENDPAGLISLSLISPVLPSGYTNYRLIGYARSSSAIEWCISSIVGNSVERELFYSPIDTSSTFISNYSGSSSTQTASLSQWVPAINNTVILLSVELSISHDFPEVTCTFYASNINTTMTSSMYRVSTSNTGIDGSAIGGLLILPINLVSGIPTLYWTRQGNTNTVVNARIQGFRFTI